MSDLDHLAKRCAAICTKNDWQRDWKEGGCYLHLEVSEFIESLRGKGDSTPMEEAADVLFMLFSVAEMHHMKPSEIVKTLEALCSKLEK